ncbi:hypothetical protein Lesp02_61420 [Lentzea sp. NBRC 105346]|uniref:hypothetical protein n=1 Tax=Lentzea sp. NBRC 105346 TaxID=3032205 RepID=UPI0025576B7F|nr:hypothetical protein [Lentzea sp. NBRC 105346]GLZ33954.1 hypothetical protein Lesp02_61420 [Lentzea sp. NBRC 105346]
MSNDLVLEIDHESAGLLAGTLLAGDSCAVPVRHQNVKLLLCALPGENGMKLYLRRNST